MIVGGKRVLVTTILGTELQGVTRWSWSWVRIRGVIARQGSDPFEVEGTVAIPPHSIETMQVLGKAGQ